MENLKIIWRQTASSILSVVDDKSRWFRNTIQCAYFKPEYRNKVDIYYALGIFNSKLMVFLYRQLVMELGRVFPQVKITYLRQLPFVIGSENQQKKISSLAMKMIILYKEFGGTDKNSDKWNSIKSEIEKTDRKIDEEIYMLYGLTQNEIEIVKGCKNVS